MAKMIPAAISPKVKSTAERKIYEWFKNDPMTKDWVVFHSLGIENHQTVVFGEIDFLVAASNCGVFALEVKGGRIRRENGVWIYTDKYGIEHEKVRGPFEQASEGMYIYRHEQENGMGVGYKLPSEGTDAYFWLFKNKLDYSLDNSPVNVVGVKLTNKPIKKSVTFHALVVHYVIIIADFFEYRYFGKFAVQRVYMCHCFILFHISPHATRLIPPPNEQTPIVPNSEQQSSVLFQT